jgi:hypothetical protein
MESAISTASLLTSSLVNQKTMMAASIAVMNKTNNVAKQQGEALVQLIDNSLPQSSGRLLDTYA